MVDVDYRRAHFGEQVGDMLPENQDSLPSTYGGELLTNEDG